MEGTRDSSNDNGETHVEIISNKTSDSNEKENNMDKDKGGLFRTF